MGLRAALLALPFPGGFQAPCCVERCLSSPAGGFAKSSLSCALGNCRRKTDTAAFFLAAFLWGTNTLAGVEFQSVIPNTFSSLETFIFHEALVLQLFGRSMHFSSAFPGAERKNFSQNLLGGQTGGNWERLQRTCGGGGSLEVSGQVTMWNQSPRPGESF